MLARKSTFHDQKTFGLTKNSTTRRSSVPFTLLCFLLVFLTAVLLFLIENVLPDSNRVGQVNRHPFNFQLFLGHRRECGQSVKAPRAKIAARWLLMRLSSGELTLCRFRWNSVTRAV